MSVVATRALGEVEIEPADIFHFSEGLFGFHDVTEFVLLVEKPDSPFRWLQSTQRENLAFIVIDPDLFLKEPYRPVIAQGDLEALQANEVSDCMVFTIVTIPHNQPGKMTANLQGPVLFNVEKKLGRQVISNHEAHLVRVPIIEQVDG